MNLLCRRIHGISGANKSEEIFQYLLSQGYIDGKGKIQDVMKITFNNNELSEDKDGKEMLNAAKFVKADNFDTFSTNF
ncbi:hypothetical protein [Xenorhabdus griffiniae]|uniref:hypothetical protein n=1 Tax=Xenorhabdus griffiniae TaxID=351672 RepID=UPI00235895AF|nr:hypothetical protein [Xenorhabdus griffiniae]MDC9606330.1 hypothetical protein [Xenorhabdus griffiniae]